MYKRQRFLGHGNGIRSRWCKKSVLLVAGWRLTAGACAPFLGTSLHPRLGHIPGFKRLNQPHCGRRWRWRRHNNNNKNRNRNKRGRERVGHMGHARRLQVAWEILVGAELLKQGPPGACATLKWWRRGVGPTLPAMGQRSITQKRRAAGQGLKRPHNRGQRGGARTGWTWSAMRGAAAARAGRARRCRS